MNPLRILMVGDYPNDPRLGSAKVPHKLAEEFRALGHDCDLLFAEDLGPWPTRMHARFVCGPLLAMRAIRHAFRQRGSYDMIDIASGEGAAVPWLRSTGGLPPTTAVISRSNGLEHCNYQRMLDDHDAGLLHKPWYKRWWYPLTRLRQVRQAAQAADRVLTINSGDRQYILDNHWVPADRVVTIGHGVSASFLEGSSRDGPRGRGILFCGTWSGVKGIDYLARSYSAYVARGGRVRLTVLGGGPRQAVIDNFDAVARPLIDVLERVPEGQVMAAYREHDVLVFPSTYEGYGLVVPEAMSQGLPVIATPVGCVPDLIRHGETGWIVPPRDSVAVANAFDVLMSDAPLRRRLGEAGRRSVAGLTWTETARQTLELYATALAKRAPRARTIAIPANS